MSEVFLKSLSVFLTITITSIILAWISRGSGNRRLYFLGGIAVLFALAIVCFDLGRKKYNESDYSTVQITIKRCYLDELSNGRIIALDDSEYRFNRSLLWRVGSAPDLAKILCHQKNLKLRLNPENEISAFEGVDFSIPLEVGIAKDDSKHDFLAIAFIFAVPGLVLIIISFRHDRKGEKINF
jgi:hypothetical protein